MAGRLTLILGGARSGKSTYALRLADESGQGVTYVATATASDGEMAQRIERHRAERPRSWNTVEATCRIGEVVAGLAPPPSVVLLDCMTMLASNVIMALPEPVGYDEADRALNAEVEGLVAAIRSGSAHWIVVSNEVGLGLVPPYPLGRVYRDALGRANQQLAQSADEVLFLVAGLPLKVK